jgi:transposase, IS5 family
MRGQPGFFDVDERLKRLSDLGDHLEAFRFAVNFEMFRNELNASLGYSDGAQGGRPAFDPVMMFKTLSFRRWTIFRTSSYVDIR